MADITYDIDMLRSAKSAIDNLKETLDTDNQNLTIALENLKNGWNTSAGKKFFEDHKDTWSEYVKKYVQKLTGVSDMLQKAIDQYEKIGSDVRNLKV